MKQGIKEKDIRDFEKIVKKLDEILERIRQYKPMAYIYVTPSQLHLMSDTNGEMYSNQEYIVASEYVVNLDCGDW